MSMRDSHTLIQRQIDEDVKRNAQAFCFFVPTEDIERNDRQPIVLCEQCGQHTHGEYDGDIVLGNCEHCGEDFGYSRNDARVVSE